MAAAVTLTLLAACASNHPAAPSSGSAASTTIDGDQLSPAVVLSPAASTASFQASTGGSTSLAALQHPGLMLLYFGYTHCPDVCPTTMADLGQALQTLPSQVQVHTQVVFVTSDPDRDTPAVMKEWLAHFDTGLLRPFVGLTASLTQIDAVARSVGVPLEPPVKEPDGSISVEHGAQTLAFINGKASVLWLAGTTPTQYAHDITLLADQASTT